VKSVEERWAVTIARAAAEMEAFDSLPKPLRDYLQNSPVSWNVRWVRDNYLAHGDATGMISFLRKQEKTVLCQ